MKQCPLCKSIDMAPWHQDRRRSYWRCETCGLVSVPPQFHLDEAAEKAVYDLHQNDVADAGYRRFLGRLVQPLLARLAPHSAGLDFGCGPGPVLAEMLKEAGHQVALYDKFYQPDSAVLERCYDFVTASEVVEHLVQPAQVWQSCYDLLRPGGWLGIMTKRVQDQAAFARWHYIQDATHVSFYSEATIHWIAQHWGFTYEFVAADVVLLQKIGL